MSCETIDINPSIKQANYYALDRFYNNKNSLYTSYSDIIENDVDTYKPKDTQDVFNDNFKALYSNQINTDLNNIEQGLSNLHISNRSSNIYANCVLQSGSKWFTTSDTYDKCVVLNDIKLPKTIINKNNSYYTNFSSKNKPGKSLYASNINKAYCENRWYDWIVTPNYYLGNTYFKDIGKYTTLDINRCYKPCDGDSMPYMTEKNEYMCIPKKYYGNGIFNNKYMFSPIGLINLIGNFAATLNPDLNKKNNNNNSNNDYNFILYKLILEYNLTANVDSNIYSVQDNTSNLVINYNNVYDDFKDIYNELNECLNNNILNNFINSKNQDYYYSPNFNYKSPIFNENEPEMYTLKGLQANNILIDPILIHTWILANTFKPFPNDIDISKTDLPTKQAINYSIQGNSYTLYDILSSKFNDEESINNYKAERLKNIFYKAVNLCYNNKTDFSKNIIVNTINALNNNKLLSYIYSQNIYVPQKSSSISEATRESIKGSSTTRYITDTYQNSNIGLSSNIAIINEVKQVTYNEISNIQILKQVLTQTALENFKPYKLYNDKDIANIKKYYDFKNITLGASDDKIKPIEKINYYLFAYEDLEQSTCIEGQIYDKESNKCIPAPPKTTKAGIDDLDNFDDELQIPKLKSIFSQFLKIVIAIIIVYIIWVLYIIWYETIVEILDYLYLKFYSISISIKTFLNQDNKNLHNYEKEKYLYENLISNKEKIDEYLIDIKKNKKSN